MPLFVLILTLGIISPIHSHHLSNLATCVTRLHVIGDFCHITCLSKTVLWHPTLGASKNVKFRLSQNSTKFDVLARFRETIPTAKSVSSSEIYKIFLFLPKLQFCPFSENLNFLGSYTIDGVEPFDLQNGT